MASRQKDVKKIYKKLKKRYPDVPILLSRERKILEHLVFAIFLENVSFDRAREAFTAMENYFIDWNEIRVSKANEIADVVPAIPNASTVGERLRRLLQWIFDETYKFDLEDVRAKGRDEFYAFLIKIPFSTSFMNDYVSLCCFGEGSFPLGEGELRALRLLDFVETSEDNREIAPALEDGFDAKERMEFFYALHELGSELTDDSKRDAAIKFLCSIDSKVAERSWEPLVEAAGPTDPREIAKLVAKQEKRQKRATPSLLDAMDLLDDSIDDPEDLEPADVLSDEAEESKDFNGGFEGETSGDLDDSIDVAREKNLKKRRSRKGTSEKDANEETELTKNGATYSHFSSSSDDEPLFESLDGEFDEKKSGAKSRKKTRSFDDVGAFEGGGNDDKIVREDVPNDSECFPFDTKKAKNDAQDSDKLKKKTRAKGDPSVAVEETETNGVSNGTEFNVKKRENVEKEDDKKTSRKTTSKKGKETKVVSASVDENVTTEPKIKAKPKNAKNADVGDADAAEKTSSKKASKTQELQQKKPR